MNLLLLEDNPPDARTITDILGALDNPKCNVDHVDTLAAAIELAMTKPYDVAVLDLCVHDSKGIDTCARMRAAAPELPIVIQSGEEEEQIAIDAVRLGAQDYLVKSTIDAHTLPRAIRYAIERKHIERALRESEERYALALRGANDGLWDWDLKAQRVHFSDRWKSMIGEDIRLEGHPDEWIQRIHPDDLTGFRSAFKSHLDGKTPHLEYEYRLRKDDDTYAWMLCRGIAVRDDDGVAYRVAGSQTDVTQRKTAEAQLVHDALHDALTGLPNRTLFLDRLGQSLRRSLRQPNYRYAVLFLDLDGFKLINDSLGHVLGDELLVETAKRLRACLRPNDTIARMGGDEFCVLLEDIWDLADGERTAERINRRLKVPINLEGHEVFTSASIGIAYSASGYDRPEELLRDADAALYRAKELGRSRYEVFDRTLHEAAVKRLQMESDLHGALERDEMRLYFQPIIALAGGHTVGFESLVRWNCRKRGLIPPADFIPIAEDTGLIVPVGEWVLREACRQMLTWRKAELIELDCTMSVNLSCRQLMEPNLVQRVQEILNQTGFDPKCLVFEITESVLMENASSMSEPLAELRALGIKIDIDDFGTGYSSLSYLHQLPIDRLKIDRSFISAMGMNENVEIIRAILTLAHSLDIEVVAEGIETEEQLQRLQLLNCEFGQGFLFARPAAGQEQTFASYPMAM